MCHGGKTWLGPGRNGTVPAPCLLPCSSDGPSSVPFPFASGLPAEPPAQRPRSKNGAGAFTPSLPSFVKFSGARVIGSATFTIGAMPPVKIEGHNKAILSLTALDCPENFPERAKPKKISWGGWWDLNPRHPEPQSEHGCTEAYRRTLTRSKFKDRLPDRYGRKRTHKLQ